MRSHVGLDDLKGLFQPNSVNSKAKYPISCHLTTPLPHPGARSPPLHPTDTPKHPVPGPAVPPSPPRQRRDVSPAGMALSVLVILLLSVLYEAVKMGKAVLLRRALLALPRSLSQEALTEPQEEDSGPAQGRYHRGPLAPTWGARGCLCAPWPARRGEGL